MSIATSSLIVAVIALVIAAIAVTGGVIELLRQKIIIDKDTKQVVEVELPGLGKFKSNYPSAVAIFFGVIIIIGVFRWLDVQIAKIPFSATVTVYNRGSEERKSADVFVSVVPQRYRYNQSGIPVGQSAEIEFPVDGGEQYHVIIETLERLYPDGTTQWSTAKGPMRVKNINGIEKGTYSGELTVR